MSQAEIDLIQQQRLRSLALSRAEWTRLNEFMQILAVSTMNYSVLTR
jgi:hypothetical protein